MLTSGHYVTGCKEYPALTTSRDGREPLANVRDRVQARVVGRERELALLLAAVAAGRDVLLEGPPGTSKSTLLRAITAEWGIPLVFVEGNADLTPAKLVGHHNPARVLREDYSPANFVDGPLVEAMRAGGFLYIEEFNRAPEDTINTLLTAMAERRIAVPRAGEVVARDTFRVIASMNPYDNIGTTRLSTSVHDRLCRLAITYQDAAAERGIVTLRAPVPDLKPAVYERLVADAVAVTRATRQHEDIRQGSSVRGAIDLTLVAGQLLKLDTPASESETPGRGDAAEQSHRDTVYDAMVVALSGRIFLDETVDVTPEQVLRQIWEDHFILDPAAAAPG
ncbi:MoxR family ATPase [Trebonia kvetii]|uniref:MoxR family ATPase n=1 Tax=Trebonia kvetii TaxID=2480626 RepID=A0A6P2C7I1_9ACTN|nr:MoxR family ATPase [Trebonia kvetii]